MTISDTSICDISNMLLVASQSLFSIYETADIVTTSAIHRTVECITLAFISLWHPLDSSILFVFSVKEWLWFLCTERYVSIFIYGIYARIAEKKVEGKIDATQDSFRKCHNSMISVPVYHQYWWFDYFVCDLWYYNIFTTPFKINIASFDVNRIFLSLFFFIDCAFLRQDKGRKKKIVSPVLLSFCWSYRLSRGGISRIVAVGIPLE